MSMDIIGAKAAAEPARARATVAREIMLSTRGFGLQVGNEAKKPAQEDLNFFLFL
jgi:hypothetical protein